MQGRRSESARAKGRVTLTRADVIRAGAQLLDAEGVEQLSMRRLAKALGTGSSTLYWHVRDRDELLLGILDETLADVAIATDGTWDERLRETLVRCHQALLPRPALIDVLWGAAWRLGPETLRVADGLVGLVAESGLPDDEVADSYLALLSLLFGFVAGERSSPGNPRFSEAVAGDDAADTEIVAEQYPNLARYGPGAAQEALERQFGYALDRFLTGIGARAAELAAAPPKRARKTPAAKKPRA